MSELDNIRKRVKKEGICGTPVFGDLLHIATKQEAELESLRGSLDEWKADFKAIESELALLRTENEKLKQWKSEQLSVESSWDEQEVGRLLGLTMGSAIRKNIARGIQELRTERDKLDDELRAVMYSVDKWFDSVPDDNPATRAADAREIALRAIDELCTERDRLRDALANYGQHEIGCIAGQARGGRATEDGNYERLYGYDNHAKWYRRGESPPCSCGLDSALQSALQETDHA